jgi:hypothetical protein
MIEATSVSSRDRRLIAQKFMLPGFIFLEAQSPSTDHTQGSDGTGFCDCPLNGCEVGTANGCSWPGQHAKGTPEEYAEAVLGSSTHTGRVVVDPIRGKLIFNIEAASYPNWEGTRQVRDYTFKDGTLTYSVPAIASSDGTIAYSVW